MIEEGRVCVLFRFQSRCGGVFDRMAQNDRPGFTGECFVQMSGSFIKGVQVCIEGLLCFLRRDVSDGAVEALGVVPADLFQCFPFDLADRFPRAEEFDDFGFEPRT